MSDNDHPETAPSIRARISGVVKDGFELFRSPFVAPFEEQLRAAQAETMLSRTKVLIWMSVVVMPTAIWSFTGYFKSDNLIYAISIVLFAIVAILIINALIGRGFFDRRYHLPLALVVGGVFSPVAAAIMALTHQSDGNYLFAYFLIYFAFTSLFPASASWVLITSGAVIASYVSVSLAIIPESFNETMVVNILYMLELTFIGIILNRVICRLFFDEKRSRLELGEANIGLRELDQAKTKFFSNMNHELRTLLTLILTPLNVALQRRDLPDGLDKSLIGIRANAVHLLKTVNMLLDVSRLEAGQIKINRAELRVDDLMRYTASLFEGAAKYQGLNLELDLQAGDLTVYTDIEKIEQVLVNLIGNAFKFTPTGGTITLTSRHDGSSFSLAVTDTGVGIAPEDQKVIFQRFGQVQEAQKASVKGTGIGLSMVREYASLLGGNVELESTPGEGSTFRVLIPVVRVPEQTASRALPSPVDSSAPPPKLTMSEEISRQMATADLFREEAHFEPMKACGNVDAPWLLVVDDNPSLVRLVSTILGDEYNLYRASSGEEALAMLEEHRIDLVVSDVMMPGIGGLELCRRVKTDPRFETIPVILLTARGDTADKIQGLELGADDYIGKPFDPEELRARVSSLFERRRLTDRLLEQSAALQTALGDLKAEGVKLVASEKMRTLGDLATGIFHELHNYMNMLYNGALPLKELVTMVGEDTESVTEEDIAEILELAELITDAAQASVAITGELKAYAHQGGNDLQRVNINDVIRSNIRLFGKLPPSLEVVMDFSEEEMLIECVPSRMLMVFTNLAKNSFEAMNQQGSVTISTARRGDQVLIQLSDTGPGIPASFKERLFQPFQTTKPSGKGLGLGLSLASKVVAELEGQISYDHDYTDGARFIIELPLASVASKAA